VTINTATLGIQGVDTKTISGTHATNSGNATVTGTSSNYLTDFGTRTGSGTIAGASTTITGTNTKFLTEFSCGDLIGTNAKGYSRITAIAADNSLTIIAAIPGGDPSGTAPVCIENAWLQVAAQTIQRINTITSNTSLALAANSSATQSGQTATIGALPALNGYLMVWIGTGGSGTGCYLSTQRTTPFGVAGYNTSVRRIGSCLYSAGLIAFDQWGAYGERWYQYEVASGAPFTVVSNAANTGWTGFDNSPVAPPTASYLSLDVTLTTGGVAGLQAFFRKRGAGSASTTRNLSVQNSTLSATQSSMIECACDGVQFVDYVTNNTSAGNGIYVAVAGYEESLY
jgi:hypothetical protein